MNLLDLLDLNQRLVAYPIALGKGQLMYTIGRFGMFAIQRSRNHIQKKFVVNKALIERHFAP